MDFWVVLERIPLLTGLVIWSTLGDFFSTLVDRNICKKGEYLGPQMLLGNTN